MEKSFLRLKSQNGPLWTGYSVFYLVVKTIALESKFDEKYDGDLGLVFQNLPYRVTKNSKFVGAMLIIKGLLNF